MHKAWGKVYNTHRFLGGDCVKIAIRDCREDDINFGFLTIEDGEGYIHASVYLYNNTAYFRNFMSGRRNDCL